jgi:hypothetical protein
MTDFVQALQGYMQEKNIGQRGLARLLGRAHSTISQWLSGHKICKTQAEVLLKLGLEPLLPPQPQPVPSQFAVSLHPSLALAIGYVRHRPRKLIHSTRPEIACVAARLVVPRLLLIRSAKLTVQYPRDARGYFEVRYSL